MIDDYKLLIMERRIYNRAIRELNLKYSFYRYYMIFYSFNPSNRLYFSHRLILNIK